MIKSIKRKFNNNKVLIENFTSLSVLQVLNYIIPLITFPYLVRVLGPEKFGLVQFAISFVSYFGLITDYGFQYSATREISINRENNNKLSEIFSSVMIIKIFLIIISIIIILPIIEFFDKFNTNSAIYYLSFIMIIGQTIFPLWFFQGIENMKFLLYFSSITKILSVILIFLFVTTSQDLLILVCINSGSTLLMGISGILISIVYFKIKIFIPKIRVLKYYFNEAGYLFLSSIAINLYTTSNIFILGLLTNDTVVGYFSVADKIRIALQGLLSAVTQSVYPHLAKLFMESKERALIFIKKLLLIFGTSIFICCLSVFLFSSDIINILAGPNFNDSVFILKIIAILPFIIFLSNIAGVQVMLNLSYKKEFFLILFIASVTNILLSLLFVPHLLGIGTALSMLITEIFVTSAMFIFLLKKGVKLI